MNNLDKLYEYQQVDMELFAIESALKKSDARKALAKSRNTLLEGQKSAETYEKSIETQKSELETIMGHFDALNEQVQKLAADGEKVKEPDDAKELRKTAEKINRDIKKMQSSIIAKLNEVNDTQKKYHDLVVSLQEAKKTFVESKATVEKEIAEKQGEVDDIKKKLAKLEKGIDKEQMEVYNKKKKNGMPVMAKLEGDQCTGCFMKLPQLTVDHMKAAEGVVECENCGRILLVEQ